MNILDTIVAKKKEEVARRILESPVEILEQMPLFGRPTLSLKKFLDDPGRTGIIAEYKRRSPSKGVINDHSSVEEVTMAYAQHASGISVLTDTEFFGGTLNDLVAARMNEVPLLRKDFMISDYQLVEARAYGADVILLIAACLSVEQCAKLAAHAKALGLEVLLEIHDETELKYINEDVDLVGVNNRDLKTFTVDVQRSMALVRQIPSSKAAVAESGISDVETIVSLKRAGFRGFLIGENFMKHADPAIAFADFVNRLKAKNEN